MSSLGEFDYVIIGAGSAGCVLANRLSADPAVKVALLEAGPPDTSMFIHMPSGIIKVLQRDDLRWLYASIPHESTAGATEYVVRGRTLGGSSSVNGMMYVRGQPEDFDHLAQLSSDDWNWDHVSRAYKEMESHELGASDTRGDKGPLKITMPRLRDRLSNAIIAAGTKLGWQVVEDINAVGQSELIGYAPRNIYKGKRQSAATAFLAPVRSRSNLAVFTDCVVDRLILDENRQVRQIAALQKGVPVTIEVEGEAILSAGTMANPGILERSGIGDSAHLAALDIPLLHHLPTVGEHMIEHRGLLMQWEVKPGYSRNSRFYGLGLVKSALQYFLTRSGPLAAGAYEVAAQITTRPGGNRPDAQMLITPFSLDLAKNRTDVERRPGMHVILSPLRPVSTGSMHIETRDPTVSARYTPNYRESDEEKEVMVRAVRKVREMMQQEPLAGLVVGETSPGITYATDEQIIEAFDRLGVSGHHAVGTCRMGKDENSVVDPELRVRGIEGLRVMDASIFPIMPAGNTNAPVMACAWLAAGIIQRTRRLA